MGPLVRDFPLFPLGLVALPTELVPLHIFEERYKTMMARVLEEEGEFGIVWVSDDGLRPIGCACEVAEVLERMPDGRLNLVARGTRAFRIERRQDELAYPAGVVEFLEDRPEDPTTRPPPRRTRSTPTSSRRRPTGRPDADEVGAMSAYEMAATVDFGLEAKQGLLDLRSESARLKLVTRLFRGAIKRLDFVERAQARARSNGKVRFEAGHLTRARGLAAQLADPARRDAGEGGEPEVGRRLPARGVGRSRWSRRPARRGSGRWCCGPGRSGARGRAPPAAEVARELAGLEQAVGVERVRLAPVAA